VATTRYRCTACGNLTRFDVTTTTTVRAFHHFSVGGELAVEDPEILAESVDEVVCRWCARPGTVEIVEESGAGEAPPTETDAAQSR
jgi:hypothetical protein